MAVRPATNSTLNASATRSCPRCAYPAAQTINAPVAAPVSYFRCPECGLLWHAPKDGDPHDVTIVSEPDWPSSPQ